jgi:hypothetical protein
MLRMELVEKGISEAIKSLGLEIFKLCRGVWMWRAGKALTIVAAVIAPLMLGSIGALAIELPIAIGLALYAPQTYYQAMLAKCKTFSKH